MTTARRSRLAWVPIIAVLLELLWIGVLVLLVLFTKGHFSIDSRETQMLDLASMVPALVGLIAGVVAFARGVGRPWTLVGTLFCALAVFSFGWELFHPEP